MLADGMPGGLKAIAAVLRESAALHIPDTVGAIVAKPSAGHTCAPAWLSGERELGANEQFYDARTSRPVHRVKPGQLQ